MAQFEKHFVQDLTQDIKVRQGGTIVFNNDNLSNVVGVALYNGKVPASVSGTVVGAVIAPDGATVPVDNGTISGNIVSITLTRACFALPGNIGVGIQVVTGDVATTVLKVIYNVELFSTDTIVDPDSRITLSLAEIQAKLDEIPTILANAQTAIDGIEAQKDTMIASIASVAGQGTDTTLTQSGVAADAKATGDQVRDLKSALGASAASQYVLSDNKAGYVNDSFTFVANNNWRSLVADLDMVLVNDTITLQRGTLYGYNENDAKISSIGFFDKTGAKLFGWYVNQAQGTVVKRTQIPDGTAYVVFNTTNVNAGFDILCNTILNQVDSLRDGVQSRHVRACTLAGSYNGGFVYAPLYVKAGDIVVIKGTYNGNNPVLFFSDGKRDSQWVRSEQIDTAYFTTGYIVPTSGWAGFTALAATETGTKSYTFSITVLTLRNIAEPMNEIVVAASNSIEDDKNSADFVCDGTDDAAVINNAISVAQRIGVPDVVLCNGTFNINSYVEYNLQGSAKKVAILVHDALGKEGITLRGRKTGILPHGTILNVQESIFDNVGNDTLSIISGGAPDAGYQGSHGFNVKDIKIVLPNAQHKCIAINMQYAYWGMVENCYLQCTGYGQDVVPVDGCIGFRGWAGWSDGVNIGIKDTYAFGFYVGFQLGGEHVICERLGTRFCYYAYTFGEYPLYADSGAQVHPITLINCNDEHSAALPKFCKSGNANTPGAGRCAVDMISFNIEAYPLITGTPLVLATEDTDGGWCGRIDYTIENNENSSSVSLPFWASGHGKHFRTTNSAQMPMGTTSERSTYAPNIAQTYYDTTLNKLLVYNGSAWVDANGTAV